MRHFSRAYLQLATCYAAFHLDTAFANKPYSKNRKKSKMSSENDEQLFEGLDDSFFEDFNPRVEGGWAGGPEDPPGEL
jgi:hypothetical protein